MMKTYGRFGKAILAFLGVMVGLLLAFRSDSVHAEDEPGFCVEVTMDVNDLYLSYMKELQARVDVQLSATGVKHLGVNVKRGTIDVLVADQDNAELAEAALNAINVDLPLYGTTEFEVVNMGDGRLVIKPESGAILEAEEAAMSALTSRTRLISNLKTNDKTKITPLSRNAFLVFAPGIGNMDEYRRPFVFSPGVDLSFRLWKQPKDGEAVPAHKPGTMQPVRRGLTNRRLVLLPRVSVADGRDLVTARVAEEGGTPGLRISFTGRGGEKLQQLTKNNPGDILAILLSNIIVGEYKIDKPVSNGKLFVPVTGTPDERDRLAEKIRSGGFQPEYKAVESKQCNS